jgi:hypothetical protein
MSNVEKIRCTWDGCWRHSSRPYGDGWAYLAVWGPPIKDGFYCRPHADAIEVVMCGDPEDDEAA